VKKKPGEKLEVQNEKRRERLKELSKELLSKLIFPHCS